jgi:ATP-dependent protease HslVU (ClpYQ) peptidase subunit
VAKDGVYLGGDSAGVAGMSLTVRADQKVFENGPMLFGFTSSFRMGQLLRYKLSPPRRYPEIDLFEYMATDFVDAVRKTLKNGGYARTDNGEDSGGTFLVAREGRLFKVQRDFQVSESMHGFDAIGCGEDYALGALHANERLAPDERVRSALEAASRFSAGVCGPFVIKRASAEETTA